MDGGHGTIAALRTFTIAEGIRDDRSAALALIFFGGGPFWVKRAVCGARLFWWEDSSAIVVHLYRARHLEPPACLRSAGGVSTPVPGHRRLDDQPIPWRPCNAASQIARARTLLGNLFMEVRSLPRESQGLWFCRLFDRGPASNSRANVCGGGDWPTADTAQTRPPLLGRLS